MARWTSIESRLARCHRLGVACKATLLSTNGIVNMIAGWSIRATCPNCSICTKTFLSHSCTLLLFNSCTKTQRPSSVTFLEAGTLCVRSPSQLLSSAEESRSEGFSSSAPSPQAPVAFSSTQLLVAQDPWFSGLQVSSTPLLSLRVLPLALANRLRRPCLLVL